MTEIELQTLARKGAEVEAAELRARLNVLESIIAGGPLTAADVEAEILAPAPPAKPRGGIWTQARRDAQGRRMRRWHRENRKRQ